MSRGQAIGNRDYVGKHVLLDAKLINIPSNQALIEIIEKGLLQSNMHVRTRQIEYFTDDKSVDTDKTVGLTAFWILEESHFSLHTYPESNYITCCCYTCGSEGNPELTIDTIISLLSVANFKKNIIDRGML